MVWWRDTEIALTPEAIEIIAKHFGKTPEQVEQIKRELRQLVIDKKNTPLPGVD